MNVGDKAKLNAGDRGTERDGHHTTIPILQRNHPKTSMNRFKNLPLIASLFLVMNSQASEISMPPNEIALLHQSAKDDVFWTFKSDALVRRGEAVPMTAICNDIGIEAIGTVSLNKTGVPQFHVEEFVDGKGRESGGMGFESRPDEKDPRLGVIDLSAGPEARRIPEGTIFQMAVNKADGASSKNAAADAQIAELMVSAAKDFDHLDKPANTDTSNTVAQPASAFLQDSFITQVREKRTFWWKVADALDFVIILLGTLAAIASIFGILRPVLQGKLAVSYGVFAALLAFGVFAHVKTYHVLDDAANADYVFDRGSPVTTFNESDGLLLQTSVPGDAHGYIALIRSKTVKDLVLERLRQDRELSQ